MALTTTANVKAYKNITGSDHDAEIARLLQAVEQFILGYTNRTILEQTTITEYQSGREGQAVLLLKNYPVASITSIHDDLLRSYGSGTLIAASNYALTNAEAGIVELDGTTFAEGVKNIKIIYSGGYASGTHERYLLEQAAIELIWLAREKGDQALIGLRSRTVADGRTDIFSKDWPTGVKEILEQFRKIDH